MYGPHHGGNSELQNMETALDRISGQSLCEVGVSHFRNTDQMTG